MNHVDAQLHQLLVTVPEAKYLLPMIPKNMHTANPYYLGAVRGAQIVLFVSLEIVRPKGTFSGLLLEAYCGKLYSRPGSLKRNTE